MAISDKKIKSITDGLMDFITPEGMTPKERDNVAKKAGLSPETLRTMSRRKSVNADTLIRLLVARGVSPKVLLNLPQTETAQLDDAESDWIKIGQKLTSEEKSQYIRLIRFLQNHWLR